MGADGERTDRADREGSPAAPEGDAGGPTDGYVHRPSGEPPEAGEAGAFDWRGWVLVGALVVALLVVPATLLVVPHARATLARFELTRRHAYILLPLAPSLLLGAVAVWSALSARPD